MCRRAFRAGFLQHRHWSAGSDFTVNATGVPDETPATPARAPARPAVPA
jgi:hypothetical protein